MKKAITLLTLLFLGSTVIYSTGCKSLAKAAVRHWTKKQKKEFIAKCKAGAVQKFDEKANSYCTCLADVAEEKYPEVEKAMALSFVQMLKMSKDCIEANR